MRRQRLWIIDGALCLLLVWGGLELRKEWNAFAKTIPPDSSPKVVAKPGANVPVGEVAAPAMNMAWTDILSKSPFSFDRNDINLDLTEAVAPPPLGPKPLLFATLLLGNEPMALMARAGSRSASPVKVGGTIDGWQVVEIQHKSVIIASGGVRESLVVGRAPTERSSEKTAAPSAPPPLASIPAPAPAPSQTTVAPSRSVNPTEPPRGGVTTVFGHVP